MNGRVYDPVLGRFMSADPIVQAPYFSQSLNRYSYVMNNPLRFTDPSGFTPDDSTNDNDQFNFYSDVARIVALLREMGAVWADIRNALAEHARGRCAAGAPAVGCPGGSQTPETPPTGPGPTVPPSTSPPGTGTPPVNPPTSTPVPPIVLPGPAAGVPGLGSTVGGMLTSPSAQRVNAYFDAAANGDWRDVLGAGLDIVGGEWRDAYSTPEGALLTTMSMVPIVGMEAAATRGALAAPRQIAASWGSSVYRHGGLMTGIEHIMYRHGFGSGFSGVSRFVQGTRLRDISNYVDSALRYGRVTPTYPGAFMVEYNVGRAIGTDIAGNAASNIRVYIRDGIIQTAFPF